VLAHWDRNGRVTGDGWQGALADNAQRDRISRHGHSIVAAMQRVRALRLRHVHKRPWHQTGGACTEYSVTTLEDASVSYTGFISPIGIAAPVRLCKIRTTKIGARSESRTACFFEDRKHREKQSNVPTWIGEGRAQTTISR